MVLLSYEKHITDHKYQPDLKFSKCRFKFFALEHHY